MYDGFVTADLGNVDQVGQAFDHIGALYRATVIGRLPKEVIEEKVEARQSLLPVPPSFHQGILHETLLRYQQDLRRSSQDPNEFKQAGYLTFWVRKLKPFRHHEIFGGTQTNEFLGLHFGLATLAVVHPEPVSKAVKNERLWKEWLYDLRYRPVSGHELAKQFEMLTIV